MRKFKRIASVIVSASMVFTSCMTYGMREMTAYAEYNKNINTSSMAISSDEFTGANDYGLADNIQDGVILHCFNWKYKDIEAELQNIAEAGFTSVQTSPAQKDSSFGAWYMMYQPESFSVQTNALGTKEELESLCTKAEAYGINVIVDVVANHLRNVGDDGLGSECFHNEGDAYYYDRKGITHGNIGIPDLKSESSIVQNKVKSYIEELKSVGVDGIRWDEAKHISVPSEEWNNQFWTVVTSVPDMYNYGEILNGPTEAGAGDTTCNALMKEYTNYMTVTDNIYSKVVREGMESGKIPGTIGNWSANGIEKNKLVYWGESHDTYSNNGEYGEATQLMDQNVIDRTYAIMAAQGRATSLYFSRPFETDKLKIKAGVKGSTHYTSKEVSEVNKFHNQMIGQKDYYKASNGCAVVCREKGAVVVKGSGSGQVTVENGGSTTAPGTYIDQISGSEWTVTATTMTGTIGDKGIAVLYNPEHISNVAYIELPDGWSTSVRCYVYDEANVDLNNKWPGVKMTKDAATGYYKYDIPEDYKRPRVIFYSSETNRYPVDGQRGFLFETQGSWLYKDGTWAEYIQTPTINEPNVNVSLATGSMFTTETETVTLMLENAISGTYSVDKGPVKKFTGTADVIIGQGKIANTDVTVDVTATDGTNTVEKTFTYKKVFSGKVADEKLTDAASLSTASELSTGSNSELPSSIYSTNPNNAVGKEATITIDGDASDWSSDMLIATGGAWDIANHWKGGHENCVLDTTALYAAYDDENLYVAWQMVNTTDTWVRPGDGPLSDGGRVLDVPLILALSIDENSVHMSNNNTYGGSIWGQKMGLTFNKDTSHVDRLLYMSGKPGYGEPSMFKAADDEGNTDYADNCIRFKDGGIEYKMATTNISSTIMGLDSTDSIDDVFNASADWVDYKTFTGSQGKHDTTFDSFYEIKIPYATLGSGIDKNYIVNNGIGAMLVATKGESALDCVPFDVSMIDNATGDYSADPSTSAEKDDIDNVTAPLARIGKMSDGGDNPPNPPITKELVVNFGADRSSPQLNTTTLTLKAEASGGKAGYKYEFFVDGKSVRSSSTSDTYIWNGFAGAHVIKVTVTDAEGSSVSSQKIYRLKGEDEEETTNSGVKETTSVNETTEHETTGKQEVTSKGEITSDSETTKTTETTEGETTRSDETTEHETISEQQTTQSISEDISGARVTLLQDKVIYDGMYHTPIVVSVVLRGVRLKNGTDYIYNEIKVKNADVYTINIKGIGDYYGTVTSQFTISRKNVSNANVSLEKSRFVYNGKCPEINVNTVEVDGEELEVYKDYEYSYPDVTNVGNYYVTIKGIGNYTGTVRAAYKIVANSVTTKQTQVISAKNKSIKLGTKGNLIGAKTSGDGKLTYKSGNTAVATVSSKGVITPKKSGKAVITITASETTRYKKATRKITITVLPKQSQSITLNSIPKFYKGKSTFNIKVKTKGNVKVKFSSSNKKIAQINNSGVVKLTGCGVVRFTITAPETVAYKKATKVIKLEILPQKVRTVKLTSSGKGNINVSWAKDDRATGYIVVFSKDSKFSENMTRTIKTTNTSISYGNMPSMKYYVKIQAVYGAGIYRGDWSDVNMVVVK